GIPEEVFDDDSEVDQGLAAIDRGVAGEGEEVTREERFHVGGPQEARAVGEPQRQRMHAAPLTVHLRGIGEAEPGGGMSRDQLERVAGGGGGGGGVGGGKAGEGGAHPGPAGGCWR